jgi:hypothetical protein
MADFRILWHEIEALIVFIGLSNLLVFSSLVWYVRLQTG